MMKTQEVAALLDKSIEQVRRYHKQGLLIATQSGRELLFDRDAVLEFARTRGIRTAEREVPQGENFMEALKRFTDMGLEVAFRKTPELPTARV
jgi:phage terminase Nu1 subunit (DNA packaging protein)